jgi:C4-dicarboxylate transporter
MKKDEIIHCLKTNDYTFKEEQKCILVKLARHYFFILNFDNEEVSSYKTSIKRLLSVRTNSLKSEFYYNLIGSFMLIFLLCIIYTDEISFYRISIIFALYIGLFLWYLIDFFYHYKRLVRIKKLLHLPAKPYLS